MRKDFLFLKKSRWLLFTLLALFAGGMSPAWADAYTCGFESSEGWSITYANYSYTLNYDDAWSLKGTSALSSYRTSSGYVYSGSQGLYFYGSDGNTSNYLITPKLKAGEISFYAKYTSSSGKKCIIYSCTKNNDDSFTIGDQLKIFSNDLTSSFAKCSYTLSKDSYVAILLYRSAIDEFSASNGLASAAKAGLGVYSDSEATSAVNDGVNLSWGLVETAQSQTYYIKNESGADFTNLTVAHEGNASVNVVSSSLTADEVVPLTITQASSGTTSDAITITAGEDLSFTINVSGTVRDASKLWCNFSEGLPTGWTNSGNYTINTSGAGDGTSGGGYAGETSYSYKLMYTPLATIAEGEKLYLQVAGYGSTVSWNEIQIRYSADGSTWTTAKTVSNIVNGSWASVEVTEIPAGTWYIGFYGRYVYFTDIYGGTESTSPVIALSQSSYDFGLISTSTTTPEAITITNTGKSELTGMTVTSDNANFTVAVTENATTIAANGGMATFNVTMAPNATGAQSATITIKSDNADDLTFTVTGAVAKDGTTTVDFNDNVLPTNWTNSSSPAWSFSDEKAVAPSGSWGTYATLTTPKLSLASDDFLAIKVKANNSSYGHLKVYTSTDGTSFSSTALKEVSYTELSTEDFKTVIVTGLTSAVKAIRIEGYQVTVDEIAGLTYAPVLTVKKGDDVQTTPAAHAFGELSANQTVTYNFNNAGAGTINITNVESSNAVFTTNWTETVAASDYNLVITANYDAAKAGEQNGAITVTTSEGEFVINLTSTFLAANAPKFAVLIGEAEQTTGADLGFGIITENTTKEFIIKNDGTGALNVTAITLPDADYTTDLETAPTSEAPLVVAAGTTKTIKVTLAATAKAIKSSKSIVISATDFEDFTFAADATVMPGAAVVDFAGNKLPDNWTYVGSWTYDTGAAYSKTNNETDLIISPKLKFNDNDFIVLKAKGGDTSTSNFVSVRTSTDNGTTWTTLKKINQSNTTFTNSDFSTIVVDGISSSVNKIAIASYWAYVDDIAGLTIDANDPKLGIYSDAECTAAVATSVTKDFGFVTADATATYYIKNDGTGTMALSLGDAPAGFTQSLDKTSVAAGEKATLTITMAAADNAGYHSGNVVVTATDLGTFTVAASGVVMDANKNYINFATTTAAVPAGWTANSWAVTKGENGYIYSGTSSNDLVSGNLTVADGEKLIISAAGNSTSYYSAASLIVSYSEDGGTTWTQKEDVSSQLLSETSWYNIVVEGIPTTANKIKFTGSNAYIQRIYGFTAVTEPIMTTTATDIAFGMQTAESTEQTFTITNDGTAVLEGLSVTLGKTGDAAEYSVALYDGENVFAGTELAVGKTITVKVKQLYDAKSLGAKSDVLTIAATGQTPVEINLTGATRDGSKYYVDFEDGNIPSSWTNATTNSWVINTQSDNKYLRQYRTSTSKIMTLPLTVATDEVLTFDAKSEYNDATLTVRYTADGGQTWNDYATYTYNNGLTSSFDTKTISGIPAGTIFLEFDGMDVGIDNLYGFAATTAPLLDVTTSETLTDNKYDFGQSLQAAPAAKVFTLTNKGNGNLVSTVAATGDVTFALATTNGELSNENKTVTLEPGETATVTVSLTFDANAPGAKTGTVTITSNAPVAEKTLNFTANVIDATALNEDFASNAKPEGWYSNGWSFTSGYAANTDATEATFITSKLSVDGTDDVLSYQARTYYKSWYDGTLTVQYSTDRKNWTDATVQPSGLNDNYQNFTVSGLAAGEYYLKFSGARVYVDNIIGWHKATPAPEHDLYIVSSTLPTTVAPGETDAFTAELKVTSLVAAEENITAKVSVGYSNNRWEVCTSEAQTIAVDGVTTYALTGTVPENLDDGDYELFVTFGDLPEVKLGTINIADRLTLSITDFKLADGQYATVQANQSNEFRADFSVTVQNTGSVGVLPYAYIYQGDVLVGYNDGDETLEPGQSKTITIAAENMSAGEGGEITFTAKARIFNLDDIDFAYATPVTLTVNAAAAKFSIAENGGNTLANGDALDFGLVKTATTKTLTITNNGTATLELLSLNNPTGFEIRTSDSDSELAPGESTEIGVTLLPNQGKVSANFAIDYVIDVANTQKTFNLTLTGRSVSEDTWTEAFNDYNAAIPVDWTNNGWSVAGEYNDYPGAAYTNTASATLMTPRLQAAEGEELTFNVVNNYYNTATYAYSSDKINWSEEVAITGTGEKSFIAPAAGNYYLRFTGRGAYLQNFVGFKLNVPEHDTEISASSVPTTGTQYADYTATVTLKENAGKAEEVTAKLMVAGEEKATKAQTITANGTTTITLTWTPDAVIAEAVKAKITVTGTGIDLATEEVDLTIAAPEELDETVGEVTNATYPSILVKHSFVEGWNTVCLPFEVAVSSIHANAVAFSFDGYNTDTKELTFNKVTTLEASKPYVIYVPAAVTEPYVFTNVEITFGNTIADNSASNGVTFQGTYAPKAAGSLTDCFGLTAAGKIVKANSSTTMKGFRAYFTGVPVGASARFIGFIDDELTGIRMITVDQNVEGVFNLQGQKIQQMKKGGLYIINGKKQVVK